MEELGRGGMGVVYAAEDTHLERRVALKVLRPDVADSSERRARFQREARAAAALNHPNIVHLYSVEDSDEVLFMTMELVRGRSLRDVLSAAAPLPLERTHAIAVQLAEGLVSAHEAGVVHRDLKPGNVMVTDDHRVKILDFGLAKLLTAVSASPDSATMMEADLSAGMTFGTARYMSPEQALGRTLDPRTDVFALGIILFEMATGRVPFEGDTLAAVFDHLLNRQPPSPQTLNPGLPSSVAAIIGRALEKDPERRYRSAGELLQDLRLVDPTNASVTAPVRTAAEVRRPASIAVLPFVDMSPGKDQEYFCHGITEEIINTLTTVPGLRVISRTSAFALQGSHLEVTEIGRRLKVATVLEGSVRKAGDRLRVTTQLVNAEDGYQVWGKRFDRDLSDVFAIQDEVAATIVGEFRMALASTPAVAEDAAGKPGQRRSPLDPAVHDAYLKGMYALNHWTEDSMRRAIDCFRDAIARAPRFAPAYTALAEGQMWLYSGIGTLPASETVPQARWAVERALELDPMLADAHRMRAVIAMNHDWDRAGAAAAMARALELGPGSASTHLRNAWRLVLLERRHDEALEELEEAERLDPLDLQLKTLIGYVHHFRHDLKRAIQHYERVVALEPGFAFAHYALGDAFTQSGQYDRAFAAFDKAIELGGRTVNHLGVLGYAYGLAGHHDRAKALLQELMARASEGYVSAIWIALVHLGLSDFANLFQALDRAFEERDGSLVLITAALEFDVVRDDARFTALLGRMGLGHLA